MPLENASRGLEEGLPQEAPAVVTHAGNGPRLLQAGSASYSYDAAGDQILQDGPIADLHLDYDDARQLARLSPQASGFPQTSMLYDGRGFLRQSLFEPAFGVLRPRQCRFSLALGEEIF